MRTIEKICRRSAIAPARAPGAPLKLARGRSQSWRNIQGASRLWRDPADVN